MPEVHRTNDSPELQCSCRLTQCSTIIKDMFLGVGNPKFKSLVNSEASGVTRHVTDSVFLLTVVRIPF